MNETWVEKVTSPTSPTETKERSERLLTAAGGGIFRETSPTLDERGEIFGCGRAAKHEARIRPPARKTTRKNAQI